MPCLQLAAPGASSAGQHPREGCIVARLIYSFPVMLALKIFFGLALALTIIGGLIVLKKWDQIFGRALDCRSETPGEISYNKVQVVAVWLIAIKLLLWMFFSF